MHLDENENNELWNETKRRIESLSYFKKKSMLNVVTSLLVVRLLFMGIRYSLYFYEVESIFSKLCIKNQHVIIEWNHKNQQKMKLHTRKPFVRYVLLSFNVDAISLFIYFSLRSMLYSIIVLLFLIGF